MTVDKGENMPETVTIPTEVYQKMVKDIEFLDCLRCTGVDNWQGYEDAQDFYDAPEFDPKTGRVKNT